MTILAPLLFFLWVFLWSDAADGGLKPENDRESAYTEIELLTEVILHIRKYYVEEKSYKDITYGALHGMLRSLDPYSDFLEPEAYGEIQEGTSGKFSGIGIHIGIRDGVLTVIAPIEDTPAFRAGLQSGDRIVEIDGEKTVGITLREAVKKLRGPKEEKVKVTIRRKNDEGPVAVEIIRDNIEVPSIKGARLIGDGIGYIRITQFAAPTADSLEEALAELLGDGMKVLVLDLRSNPGGLLRSAIEVCQKFLKKGQLIVTTKGRDGVRDRVENVARGSHHYVDFLMAVLINAGSASASEIVAGALQDHNRAVLVGETTFGKGSVQSVIRLDPNKKCAVRLTVARYCTPNGREIHDKGIEPDIQVSVLPEEWRKVQIRRAHVENPDHFSDEEQASYSDVVDYQLQRAVDLLDAIRIFK